jgi:nitrate/nitrite transport system substrate-binding protein
VYRPDLYRKAAELLVKDGVIEAAEIPDTDGFKPATSEFIDGVSYDGRKPNDYLAKFRVGRQAGAPGAAH